MKKIGVIAELNPLHLGHKYVFDSIKQNNNAVICVLSSNFVQRGDTAIISKFDRAKMALLNGADCVLELPTPWAMSTAQSFAFGAVSLLNSLGNTDGICFGSECGSVDLLKRTADILNSDKFNLSLKKEISSNESFAAIRTRILKDIAPECAAVLENPNDTLGVEYISAANRLNADLEIDCVKRIGASHDGDNASVTASASSIRQHILNNDWAFAEKYMPPSALEILKKANISNIHSIEKAILSALRVKALKGDLRDIADTSEGIENRLTEAILSSVTLDELYDRIKTKRYPLARIRRLVLSAFLGIDSSFFGKEVPYIRVLAFNKTGENILSDATRKTDKPIIISGADANRLDGFAKKVWDLENLCTDIYSLTQNSPQGCGNEYYYKIYKGEV